MALVVDPIVYYDSAKKLSDLADELDKACKTLTGSLAATGSMAGATDSALAWAKGYDTRAISATDTAHRLGQSMRYYSGLLKLAGYNHYVANFNAQVNPNWNAAPERPADPVVPTSSNWQYPPAAGGRGQGLETCIPNLLEQIGIPVPDGHTDRLKAAAEAWHAFSNCAAVTDAQLIIGSAMAHINDINSPEIPDIRESLDSLSTVARNLALSTYSLEADCNNHRDELEKIRKKMKDLLDELIDFIEESIVVNILVDIVSAGVGFLLGAATAAKWAVEIERCAKAIAKVIQESKLARIFEKAAKAEDELAAAASDLNKIDSLAVKTLDSKVVAAERNATIQSSEATGQGVTRQQADEIIREAERTGSGLKSDKYHRSATFAAEDIGTKGIVFDIVGGDGAARTLVQMPGELNGVTGRFEWILQDGKVTHQMFVKNGTINGKPITP
ncbi:hypothetical protein ACIBCN_19140 [Nocardia sp. NPDC051052]|uniref:hypothetical protein n=1 Tax=Nocardia sp. NPDC051052 TaxID=3364322 RepID=UPI0037B2CDC5